MSYSKTANATLKMAGWEEQVKEDIDKGEGETKNGVYYPKRGVTISEASFTYSGDLEGTSTVLYLITYKPDQAARCWPWSASSAASGAARAASS